MSKRSANRRGTSQSFDSGGLTPHLTTSSDLLAYWPARSRLPSKADGEMIAVMKRAVGRRRRSSRSGALRPVLVGLLIGAFAAAAAPAAVASHHTPPGPLYRVALSGADRIEWTVKQEGLEEGGPPLGCIGSSSETLRFAASASLGAKPLTGAVSYYGRNFPRLFTRATFGSLAAGGSIQTAGSFASDPSEPFAPSPAECVYVPKRTEAKCAFVNRGELEAGALFQLSPNLGVRPTVPLQRGNPLYLYAGTPVSVTCDQPAIEGELFREADGVETKLRVGAVLSLRKGRSLSDSGSASFPYIGFDGKSDGTETIDYRVRVARVR